MFVNHPEDLFGKKKQNKKNDSRENVLFTHRDAQFIDLLRHGLRYPSRIGRSARRVWNYKASNQRRAYHGSHVHSSRYCDFQMISLG